MVRTQPDGGLAAYARCLACVGIEWGGTHAASLTIQHRGLLEVEAERTQLASVSAGILPVAI